MSEYEGATLAIILILIVCIAIFIIYAMWMVAGFICSTFGWKDYDSLAQFFTFIVITVLCGAKVSTK